MLSDDLAFTNSLTFELIDLNLIAMPKHGLSHTFVSCVNRQCIGQSGNDWSEHLPVAPESVHRFRDEAGFESDDQRVGASDPESRGYGKLTAYPVIVQVTVPLGKAIGKRTSQNGDVPGSA